MCLCVCAFVCIHRGGFFGLKDVADTLGCTKERSYVFGHDIRCFRQVPSALFLNLTYLIYKVEIMAHPAKKKIICDK